MWTHICCSARGCMGKAATFGRILIGALWFEEIYIMFKNQKRIKTLNSLKKKMNYSLF